MPLTPVPLSFQSEDQLEKDLQGLLHGAKGQPKLAAMIDFGRFQNLASQHDSTLQLVQTCLCEAKRLCRMDGSYGVASYWDGAKLYAEFTVDAVRPQPAIKFKLSNGYRHYCSHVKCKEAYKETVLALQCMQEKVFVSPKWKMTAEQFTEMTTAVAKDHPELWWFKAGLYWRNPQGFVTSFIATDYKEAEIHRLNAQLDDYINNVAGYYNISSFHPVQKLYFLQSLFVKTLVYDLTPKDPFVFKHIRDIVGCFITRKCVCAAMAFGFKYLCDRIGINAIYVTGWTGPEPDKHVQGSYHAWNYVQVGQEWYALDPTWNQKDQTICRYLNVDDRYINADHRVDPEVHAPPAPSMAMNYYQVQKRRIHDCDISAEEQFREILKRELQKMGGQKNRMVTVFIDSPTIVAKNCKFAETAVKVGIETRQPFALEKYLQWDKMLNFVIAKASNIFYEMPAKGQEVLGAKYILPMTKDQLFAALQKVGYSHRSTYQIIGEFVQLVFHE